MPVVSPGNGRFYDAASGRELTGAEASAALQEEQQDLVEYVLFASDRADAKALCDEALTLEYIERLERIARAAWAYHQESPPINDLIISYRNNLFDALNSVNFLNEQP